MMGSKQDYFPLAVTTVLQGLRRLRVRQNASFVLTYEPGLKTALDSDTTTEAFKAAVHAAAAADVVVAVVGIDGSIEYEGADRVSVSLPLGQQRLLKAVAAARQQASTGTGGLVAVLVNGGPVGPRSCFLTAGGNAT
jgi:beta-D-xylosidase 4